MHKAIIMLAATSLAGCSSTTGAPLQTSGIAPAATASTAATSPKTTKRPISMTMPDGTIMDCQPMNSRWGFYGNEWCDHPPAGATLNY